MTNPSVSVNEVLPEVHGAAEESELLKLLQNAGLEEWYSKFLAFGYETVEDVQGMDERCMEEIGLRGGHRIRLERVLQSQAGKPTQAHTTTARPENIHSQPPLCQQGNCKQIAGSKCRECNKLLCLVHVSTIQKKESVGNTTVIKDIPGCSACKKACEDADQRRSIIQCAVGVGVLIIGGGIFGSMASSM